MSQKDYIMQMVIALLRHENHIRGLAKEINANQTTVARKINWLYKQNVVDYKQVGRNKTFFIKKTLEAKQYACMSELWKLLEAIKKYPQLRAIVESIRKTKGVNVAILFGSYAKGTATKESDIDVYIETEDKSIKELVSRIDSRLSVKIGKYNKQNLLIQEIEKNHIILKGVEEYYEKFFM